jgi:uncharacterized protein (DUF849 family)
LLTIVARQEHSAVAVAFEMVASAASAVVDAGAAVVVQQYALAQ